MQNNAVHYTFGIVPEVYKRLLSQAPHILIAGATGSGKSICLNGIIYTALYQDIDLILIDPKRVELARYRQVAAIYADDTQTAERALEAALDLVEERFKRMQKQKLLESNEKRVFVVIDELADLLMASKAAKRTLVRILQLGRAARVSVLCATQCVLAKVLSTELLVNLDYRIALRTATAAHSRLIIGTAGAERFPVPRIAGYAEMYISGGGLLEELTMPYVPESTIREAINYRIREGKMGKPPRRSLFQVIRSLF